MASKKKYGFTGSKTFNLNDFRELQKDIRKANQRIVRIEKRYGEGAWAVNDLYNKINTNAIRGISSLSGQIRISKTMSTAQLNAVRRATNEFLAAKTSKLTGIRQAKENVMNSLQKVLSTDDVEISDKEIQSLYKIVEDKDTRSTAEKIGASTLWNLMIDAKVKKANQTDFLQTVKDYYNFSNDLDVKDDLKRFYKQYIK